MGGLGKSSFSFQTYLYGPPSSLNFSTSADIWLLDSINLSRDLRSTVDKQTKIFYVYIIVLDRVGSVYIHIKLVYCSNTCVNNMFSLWDYIQHYKSYLFVIHVRYFWFNQDVKLRLENSNKSVIDYSKYLLINLVQKNKSGKNNNPRIKILW